MTTSPPETVTPPKPAQAAHAEDCAWNKTRLTLARRCTCGASPALQPQPADAPDVPGVVQTGCYLCGRFVDTREKEDGGDGFGCQLDDGRWACSFDCWEAAVGTPAITPNPVPGGEDGALREAAQDVINWCDLAVKLHLEFDSHGVRNLVGPVFDKLRLVLAAQSSASQEPVAWECHDLITGEVTAITDRKHAESRAVQRYEGEPVWLVRPLFAATPTDAQEAAEPPAASGDVGIVALEACPFCGVNAFHEEADGQGYVVECWSCPASMKGSSEASLIAAWNTRTTPPAEAPARDAEGDRMRETLTLSHDAIAEFYRYSTGGETRGSYDGKPEREGLWKAMYAAREALRSGARA